MITIIQKGVPDQIVNPTIFPDKTSQVWKLDFDRYDDQKLIDVVWHFDEEAELIWMNQLICLFYQQGKQINNLYMPYLPYGRQDKEVSNESTFAKEVFLEILMKEHIGGFLTTLDAHSYHPKIVSYPATPYINKAIDEFQPHVLVFPDSGAYDRYAGVYVAEKCPIIVLDKVRDQKTGWITSLKLDTELSNAQFSSSMATRFLIVDDICDGGATFERASRFLHENYKHSLVGLYVTHGIFSKGFEALINSGISRFYTTQSLLRNTDGYPLIEV
jgi:phosphoribosylpyrophosphate synthetase